MRGTKNVTQSSRSWAVAIVLLLCTMSTPVLAQPLDTISTPRITVNGRQMWVHTVTKGETLYAISRRYSVSQADIAAHNPDIYYGIKKGQKLKIPVPVGYQSAQPRAQGEYVIHVVQPGENLYQLSRQFSVSVQSIRQANGLTSDTLKVHETIRIPTHDNASSGAATGQPTLHIVQKSEGLYGIARQYGVSQEEILAANPGLSSRGLQPGDLLRIPPPRQGPEVTSPLQLSPEGYEALCDSAIPFPKWKTLEIALALPFSLGKAGATSHDDDERSSELTSRTGADARFVEFYNGVLLAVERFKLQGRNFRLRIFDTQRNPDRMRQIVESDSLSTAHLVIGPVYPQNISIAGLYTAQRRINIVSPLSGKTPSFDTNPYLFQANPSFLTQMRRMVRSLPLQQVRRIMVLCEEGGSESDLVENLQLLLQSALVSAGRSDSVEVRTVSMGKGKLAQTSAAILKTHLLPGTENIVIVPSNHEPFVSEALGILNSLAVSKRYPITVYGMPKWIKLPKLDLDALINLRVTCFSPFFVDYTKPAVMEFVDTYRATYRSEPSQYAFQGYDVATYFISAIHAYGEDFRHCLRRMGSVELLQTNLEFHQSQQFGSYESAGVFLLRFSATDGIVAMPAKSAIKGSDD